MVFCLHLEWQKWSNDREHWKDSLGYPLTSYIWKYLLWNKAIRRMSKIIWYHYFPFRSMVKTPETHQPTFLWYSSKTTASRPGVFAVSSGTWLIVTWRPTNGRGWPEHGPSQMTRSEPSRSSGQVSTPRRCGQCWEQQFLMADLPGRCQGHRLGVLSEDTKSWNHLARLQLSELVRSSQLESLALLFNDLAQT